MFKVRTDAGGTKRSVTRGAATRSPSTVAVMNAEPVQTRAGPRQKQGGQALLSPPYKWTHQ
jgi:hypothetical protein